MSNQSKEIASQRIGIFGAAADTGNLGVNALSWSVIEGISQRLSNPPIVVFDHSPGCSSLQGSTNVVRCGAMYTRRLYRSECLRRVRLELRTGLTIGSSAKQIRMCATLLDISGGDSFTDLYGLHRFESVTLPKLIAIEKNIPLVLLPQTYGPFEHAKSKKKAEFIVRRARLAIARDERSFDVLKDLLGNEFDPTRHRVGVDVAFLLEPREPAKALPDLISQWVSSTDNRKNQPLVGFNVSGLIYNDPETAKTRYKFVAHYAEAVVAFLARLLDSSDANLLLVPHVLTPPGHYESDPEANQKVRSTLIEKLPASAAERIAVVPSCYDQSEMKWIISKCDWFCGTRMHSTIAGLSSGVSTAAISYSPKTLGVFETCGIGSQVVDPTVLDTADLIEALWQTWCSRNEAEATLHQHLPAVINTANEQMDLVADVCRGTAGVSS